MQVDAEVLASRVHLLRRAPHDQGDPETENIWAFHLRETGAGTCRMIERGKSRHGTSVRDRLFFSPLFDRTDQLRDEPRDTPRIKQRAERHRAQATKR
jgi:hypothetical protein